MKLIIDRKLFVKALKDVKKENVKKSAGLPEIVQNTVKIVAGLDNLELHEFGINSELSKVIKSDNVNIESMGGVVIKIKLLLKILPKLLGNQITIETAKDNKVIITSGETKLTINAMSIVDAPNDVKNPKKETVKVSGKDLKTALDGNLKDVSNQDARPVLTGVSFQIKGGKMAIYSTDSHRLAKNVLNVDNVKHKNFNMLMRGNDLKTFYRLINAKKSITINYGHVNHWGNDSELIQDNNKINIRNLEGNYPDVRGLIPEDGNIDFTINRLKFKKAIRQAMTISHIAYNNTVYLLINNGQMSIGTDSPDVGNIKTKLDGHITKYDIKDGSFRITFNPDYVKDALDGYKGVKNVTVKLLSPLRPFTISPDDDSDKLQLITPIRTF